MKPSKAVASLSLCALIITLTLWAVAGSSAQTPGQNLLRGGDFESPPPWPMQDGVSEIRVAQGWRAWYVEEAPSYVLRPNNCPDNSQPHCYWMRPEYGDANFSFPHRVRSGFYAQKYFSYGRMHEAGLYQRVMGITPGTTLRFSIHMQAWQCFDIGACGKDGIHSDAPADMHLRVGIDPFGGTNPFSSNIIWSAEMPAFDVWTRFSVEVKAMTEAATVFTHSRADWDWARSNNDVYLDDASLVVIEGTPQPITPMPALSPTATITRSALQSPLATPTARPDGSIVHTVQAGDTLYGIARQYNVPMDDLFKLNNLSITSIIELGQLIIIRAGTGATLTQTVPSVITATAPVSATASPAPTLSAPPTATPTPTASPAPTLSATPTLTATPGTTATLTVSASLTPSATPTTLPTPTPLPSPTWPPTLAPTPPPPPTALPTPTLASTRPAQPSLVGLDSMTFSRLVFAAAFVLLIGVAVLVIRHSKERK